MKLCKVDENGYFLEDVILDEIPKIAKEVEYTDENGETVVKTEMVHDKHYIRETPKGFYLPKFNFETNEWEEGKTQEEIDEILNAPRPKTELEIMQETLDMLVLSSL